MKPFSFLTSSRARPALKSGSGVVRRLGFGAACAVAVFLLYLGLLQLTGNQHVVLDGQLYRAAQLDDDGLRAAHARWGYKTVINLRGAKTGKDWYEQEKAVLRDLGVTAVDFWMSDAQILTRPRALELVRLMQEADKPLLIHCRAGADRTGLAVALYMGAIHGVPDSEARTHLSIRYGHFSVPYLSNAYPMDQSLDLLSPLSSLRPHP